MKIYIFADMEGVSGICGSSYVTADGNRYGEGCRLLAADINACISGCFAAGADKVIVRDGHGSGINLHWEDLDPRAELVQGSTPGKRFYGIEGCDAVILLGYHAMAGTHNAHLEHTFSSKTIQNMWVNGEKAGEFAIDTLIAGEYGVPVIMTSGCDRFCAEAKAFHPEVITCQVKTSITLQSAYLISREEARRLISEKSAEAVTALKAGRIPVRKVDSATLRIEYVERCEPYSGLIADRTAEYRADSLEKAFFSR